MRQGTAAYSRRGAPIAFFITYHEGRRVAASDGIGQPKTTVFVARWADHTVVFAEKPYWLKRITAMSKFEDHCQESAMLNNPKVFVDALRKVVAGLYQVFDLAAERPYDPDDDDEPLFGVSSQFDRPNEFLQTLLDMLRVFFEPDPPGTLFLNANPCFLYEALSDQPVHLGYATILGDPGESFSAMLDNRIFPRLTELGYQKEACSSAFFAICRGPGRGGRIKFSDDLLCETAMALQANISVEEAWGGLYSAIEGESRAFSKQNCVGISFDESLGDRLRVSVWLMTPAHRA